MPIDTPSTSQKLSALVYVLNQITHRGAQFVMYASSLGAIALVAKSDMPLEFLSAGIGVNLMSSVIEKVARNKGSLLPSEIENAVEKAILASNLDKLLTEDKHLRVVAKLMRQQDKIFFATKNNEYELRRLSALVEALVQSSSGPPSESTLGITHFYALSEKSDFVEDAYSKVRDLWQRAELLEKSSSIRSISLYENALAYVEAAIVEKDEVLSEKDSVQLQILLSKARERYDEFRQRHEMPISSQEGELVGLILNFSRWSDHSPEMLVTFFSGEESTAEPKVMPVAEALDIARWRLVRFWERKTSEYLDSAQSYLNEHQPRQAIATLNRCEKLPGRYEDRMGVRFPHYLEIRVEQLEAGIQPAYSGP